jgi:Mg2+ and Co2+ transporter CorA
MSSTPADNAVTPVRIWVASPAGCRTLSLAAQAARVVDEGRFAWVDLEETGNADSRLIGEILDVGAETFEMLRRAEQRPRFMPLPDATYAAVPMTNPSASPEGGPLAYMCLALTERVLLTRHTTQSPMLAQMRDQYSSLAEDAKTDGPAVLFLVLDTLIREKEAQLLSLGQRLNRLQVMLRTTSPPEIHDEIVGILRILTELVQGLTWYGSDLDDVAGTIEQLPGMRGGVTERFTRHRERVSRMRESARDYRQQAKDAFDHYSSNAANRQGQLINVLTVVATLFLPLTFLTGFFGMDFGVLVNDLNSTWAFVLAGLLLPAACIAITLLLYRRLLRQFGVERLTHPGPRA